MTRNQLTYMELIETNRSNLAREKETNRANRANEAETYRSNVARETETQRHNVVTENETRRHNEVTENETLRHNLATETLGFETLTESKRANLQRESLQFGELMVKQQQADETKRANQAQEALKLESISVSKEANRIGALNAATAQFNAIESARSNRANEAIRFSSLAETIRNDNLLDQQAQSRMLETFRSNLANEDLQRKRIATDQQRNSNQRQFNDQSLTLRSRELEEQIRHNRALEPSQISSQESQTFKNYSDGFDTIMNTIKNVVQTFGTASQPLQF